MTWVVFFGASLLIVLVAGKLADFGDAIAIRTGLGRMFIGMLLLAAATSLPELLTTINSIQIGVPNLAAGNLFGSNTFNMFLLAIIDLAFFRQRLLRGAAMRHALSGSLTMLMIGLVLFFISANIDLRIGWVGVDSLLVIGFYAVAIYLLQKDAAAAPASAGEVVDLTGVPSLLKAGIGFALATLALVLITPYLVRSANEIAVITGLGTTFVGTALVATVTSLPELVATIAAVRIGASDMAIGNLFGSNLFNMFALGLADVFFTQGRFLAVIDPAFLMVGLLGLVMTGLGLVGNLARLERRFLFIEIDALLLILTYIAGMWLLYSRGVG
jgi:cation:H+ antiporter